MIRVTPFITMLFPEQASLPVAKVTRLAGQVDASILPERLVAMLSELFGVVAALLLTIGHYRLLACTVTRRFHGL
jgi:hypothetical protein